MLAYVPSYQPPTQNSVPHDPYAPLQTTQATVPASGVTLAYRSSQQPTSSYDPYKPTSQLASGTAAHTQTTSATYSSYGSYDPYKPAQTSAPGMDVTRPESYANTSVIQTASSFAAVPPVQPSMSAPPLRPKVVNAYDPPLPPPKQPKYGSTRASSMLSPPALFSSQNDRFPVNNAYHSQSFTVSDAGQVLMAPPLTQHMYAPSPSLVGANDPLGRTSVRVPVISFGFGGKLVTCFHGSCSMNTGFDVALASRQSTDVKVHVLHKVIPESALDTSAASYPGPLFSDPGTPSASLVRTGAATQTKNKKARVVQYLEERAEEISRGIGYFHPGSIDSRRAEAKHILVQLLKVMVENDGRLSGSPQIDVAVRTALVPRLTTSSPETLTTTSALSISGHTDAQASQLSGSPFLGLTPSQDPNDTPVAVHTVRASNLDKIQDFLLRGDRRAACHYASDEKLWAHAMVIASSIDKDTWKEVVTEFVRTELTTNRHVSSVAEGSRATPNGREPLRVAYSLFAGQGPVSIQELVHPKPFAPSASTLQIPSSSMTSITPMSASFPVAAEPLNIPPEVLAKWADTAAMIFTSPMTLETSSAFTALGDQLTNNQWYEAAHACYLLSPQTSPMGGVGSSSRMVLVGYQSPSVSASFARDPDPIIFSEIVEFALSLATPAKGQEHFAGLPYLQPYRFVRAAALAEMGHVQLANRYCDAISTCVGRTSPYTNPTFLEQLKGLADRLVAAPQIDK
ncbi:hypothetical protein POSPLADRAFT_1135296, partial [Postia placenta MAD-698-R-SB12]